MEGLEAELEKVLKLAEELRSRHEAWCGKRAKARQLLASLEAERTTEPQQQQQQQQPPPPPPSPAVEAQLAAVQSQLHHAMQAGQAAEARATRAEELLQQHIASLGSGGERRGVSIDALRVDESPLSST